MLNKSSNKNKRDILVLFDIGSVQLKTDFGRFYEEASKLYGNLNPEIFQRIYESSGLEKDILSGKIGTSEYLQRVGDIISPEKYIDKEEIKRVVAYCWKESIQETISIKKRLYESGYSIGLFSNMSPLAIEIISEKFPEVLATYDDSFPSVFSFNVGHVKPELPMYEKIKDYKEVVYIDDNVNYLIIGTNQFGWKGISFTPFIDPHEPIRFGQRKNNQYPKNIQTADSVPGLEIALKKLAINI